MDGVTKSEEFRKLVTDLCNAQFECGLNVNSNVDEYIANCIHAGKCEDKLLEFLEPYLPKD